MYKKGKFAGDRKCAYCGTNHRIHFYEHSDGTMMPACSEKHARLAFDIEALNAERELKRAVVGMFSANKKVTITVSN